jgi:hypothetical protein
MSAKLTATHVVLRSTATLDMPYSGYPSQYSSMLVLLNFVVDFLDLSDNIVSMESGMLNVTPSCLNALAGSK